MARMIRPQGTGGLARPHGSRFRFALFSAVLIVSLVQRAGQCDQRLASFPRNDIRSTIAMHVSLERGPVVGMHRVPVRVRPVGPSFNREQTLTIELMPRSNPLSSISFDFRQDITLPEGAASLDTILEVPAYYRWDACRVRVFEDGTLIEGFDTEFESPQIDRRVTPQLMLGLLTSGAHGASPPKQYRYPDLRALHAVMGFNPINERDVLATNLTHSEAIAMNERFQADSELAVRNIDISEIPDSWTSYRQLDVLLTSADMLLDAHKLNPKALDELRKWVACGGCLWVYGGKPAERLNDVLQIDQPWQQPSPEEIQTALEARFSSSSSQDQLANHYEQAVLMLTQGQDFKGQTFRPVASQSDILLFQGDLDVDGVLTEREFLAYERLDENAPQRWSKLLERDFSGDGKLDMSEVYTYPWREPFLVSRYLSGTILHIRGDHPFPGSPSFWLTAYGLTAKQMLAENRIGTDIRRGDSNFWDWMIGEVGTPPVFTFLGMISVFVLLVGPASYYTFRRIKRLYMFFVFAPVVAVICSVAIGAYALLADGFGTRVRVRQVTLLNGKGDGTSWYRQTYFAGLRPSNGVQWSDECVVFPLRDRVESDRFDSRGPLLIPSDSRIVVGDGMQKFDGQFIPSRKQSQFMIFQPRSNLGGIDVEMNASGVTVVNKTKYEIAELMVADGDGDNWMAERLGPGESVAAEFTSATDANSWLRTTYVETALKPPPGYQDSEGGVFSIGSRNRKAQRRQEFFTTNDSGLGETALREQLMERAVLVRGTFVAVANIDESSIGVEGAIAVECIHFIIGPAIISGEKPIIPAKSSDATGEAGNSSATDGAETNE